MKHSYKTPTFVFLHVCAVFFATFAYAGDPPITIDHQLSVELFPKPDLLKARDVITLKGKYGGNDSLDFLLAGELRFLSPPRIVDPAAKPGDGWEIKIAPDSISRKEGGVPINRVTVRKPATLSWPDALKLEFQYSGFDPVKPRNAEDAKPGGGAKPEGIILSGADVFYPHIAAKSSDNPPPLLTFSLSVDAPGGWNVVSQGQRTADKRAPGRRLISWHSPEPMEEIFLIADRFEEYADGHKDIQTFAFLRTRDAELARKYLNAAAKYLQFYERLLGAYPYSKFALVENARETGYGMPSFTLLGSRIIRLPFILNTSYPHEILHNWWGNGVYIDPRSGNWSEGLTSYLSDHLLAELDGNGPAYRFQELTKYRNYVGTSADFPLTDFKARHNMASQAIGYGKMLMLLQMLRTEIGDPAFLLSLRRFYADYKFRYAGLDELRDTFAAISGKNLHPFFRQWMTRTGAPELELADAAFSPSASGLRLKVMQKQSGDPFDLTLPVGVWFRDRQSSKEEFRLLHAPIRQAAESVSLDVPGEPGKIVLDPYHEIFRKPGRLETPPSVGQTYGAERAAVLLPVEEKSGKYDAFVKSLSGRQGTDRDFSNALPNTAAWILGRDNMAAKLLRPQLERYGVRIDDSGITVDGKTFPWRDHGFIFTVRHPDNADFSATWVVADSRESVTGLARKLPHYGKYGYLIFSGNAPDNKHKGQWPAESAGLSREFHPGQYVLPPKPALVDFKP